MNSTEHRMTQEERYRKLLAVLIEVGVKEQPSSMREVKGFLYHLPPNSLREVCVAMGRPMVISGSVDRHEAAAAIHLWVEDGEWHSAAYSRYMAARQAEKEAAMVAYFEQFQAGG